MPTILPKKSSVLGKVPEPGDLQVGELALNPSDRRIYSKDSTGQVFHFSRPRDPSDYLLLHAVDGANLYIGRLAWADYPSDGTPAESSPAWVIYKITTNSSGEVLAEQSATGAWSNRASLSYT